MSEPKRDDGGPAFPQTYRPDGNPSLLSGYGGLTLRDYFAGQALTSCISAMTGIGPDPRITPQLITESAYGFADEMLKARAK